MKNITLFISILFLSLTQGISMEMKESKYNTLTNSEILSYSSLDSNLQYLPDDCLYNIISDLSPTEVSNFFNTCKEFNYFGLRVYFPAIFYPWININANQFKWNTLSFQSSDEECRFNFLFISNIARFINVCKHHKYETPEEIVQRKETLSEVSRHLYDETKNAFKRHNSLNKTKNKLKQFVDLVSPKNSHTYIFTPLLHWFIKYADEDVQINTVNRKFWYKIEGEYRNKDRQSGAHFFMNNISQLKFFQYLTIVERIINSEELNKKLTLELKLHDFIFRMWLSAINNKFDDQNNFFIYINSINVCEKTDPPKIQDNIYKLIKIPMIKSNPTPHQDMDGL